jgi:hypothetical protein
MQLSSYENAGEGGEEMTRRVMPLRSRAFLDLRFSFPKRHQGTIRGNKDRHSWLANECV